jgi:MFS family permease
MGGVITMNVRSNIWKLYGFRFFYSLIPAYVIERLFWEQRGMSIQEVVYTEIIFGVTVVAFEVPIADKWGRKMLLVWSGVLEGLMFLILIFAFEFWQFALAIFLAGIARSTSSGSENAMLYDTLLEIGAERTFEKHLGGLNAVDLIATIIAALSGGLLANQWSMEGNYWLSVISIGIVVCLSLALVEPSYKSESEDLFLSDYVEISIAFFRNHSDVRLVLLSGMVIGATVASSMSSGNCI